MVVESIQAFCYLQAPEMTVILVPCSPIFSSYEDFIGVITPIGIIKAY